MAENELITIRSSCMKAVVSTRGAELQSVTNGEREYLYHGNFDWTGRAPLLFPFAGRLSEDMYTIDGATYHLPQHGFARHMTFQVASASENSVTLVLRDDETTRENYPARFRLYATYTLEDNRLHASVRAVNRGENTMYFAFGNHEAFVSSPDKSRYTLVFDKPEALLALDAVDGCLTGGGIDLGREVTRLPLRSEYFTDSATLIFGGLASRCVTLNDGETPVLRLLFDTENLLIWCRSPESPYLCIEPWTNLPDAADTDHDFTRKPGVIALAPGEEREVAHTVEFF